MAAQGGIDDVVGIADTIASPVGAVTTRPLIPVAWQSVAPTLTTGSSPTPPAQGGLESDGPKATDPDFYVGSFALASVAPTLGVGSTTTPPGKGDIGDVFGAPDLGMDAQVAGLAAFQNVAPTIGPVSGSYLPPIAHGDVGDTGGPTTLQGDTNDSNAGAGTLTSWSSGTVTLTLGSIPQPRNHGDIGEMYGQGEGPIGQVVWQVAVPTLGVGALVTPTGKGDINDPYAWMDSIAYFTSQPYPIIYSENVSPSCAITGGIMYLGVYSYSENMSPSATITGGAFTSSLFVYTNWPAENMSASATITGGSFFLGLVVYSNWPAENMSPSATITGGNFFQGLVTYSNWPAENMSPSCHITGGTFT
jgi:hypothetical protein